ncbi:MAG: hypothetical protein Q7J64_05810, partial [Elusimicrobiota bacterium]|nr:hypothetical protein [Elusimicrobiota bacterium]
MKLRLLLSTLLAFGSAAPAVAQVRVVVPGQVSVVPAFSPALTPGAANFTAPALVLPGAPGLSAPALSPAAPIPALAASVISAAAAPGAVVPRFAPAKDEAHPTVTSLKDLGRLVGMAAAAAASSAFDGAAAKAALDNAAPAPVSKPQGTTSVTVVRAHTPREAAAYILSSPNTDHFIAELAAKWNGIGYLDLRVYSDAKGGS